VRGDTIEVWPAYGRGRLSASNCSATRWIAEPSSHPSPARCSKELDELYIYPAKHFVTTEDRTREAIKGIEAELAERLEQFKRKANCSKRSGSGPGRGTTSTCFARSATARASRTTPGWFSGRKPGEPPYTLLDFFPDDFLLIVDESHVTLPQVRGMYARRLRPQTTLVEHGFRLPSAMDNRPLRFDEFEKAAGQVPVPECDAGRRMSSTHVRRRGGGADHPADRAGRPDHPHPSRPAAR
jgi:excinuclease ABC subunit B